MKGSDVNFPIFFDKNNCRENDNDNYLYSDTILIGDSSLFGYSIANPFDIAGRLRELNPNKIFLNLGMPGTGPLAQVNHLKKLTNNTDFENLVWFFVEANVAGHGAPAHQQPAGLSGERALRTRHFEKATRLRFSVHERTRSRTSR